MRKFGLTCQSEKYMHYIMKGWLNGMHLEAELTPFQVKKNKEIQMISAPMAYVKNLKDFVL